MNQKYPSRLTLTVPLLLLCLSLVFSFIPARGDSQAEFLSYLPLVVRELLYHPSTGVLDETFGGDGSVNGDSLNGDDYAKALLLQPDGKLLAGGYTFDGVDSDFALARFDDDGSPDTGFGNNGWVITDFGGNDEARAMLLQPDGKIILAGYTDAGPNFDFALARYHPNGSLDTSFAADGLLVSDLNGEHDSAYGAALQPDGKLVLTGFTFNGSDNDIVLARYLADGSPDTTLGGTGWVTLQYADNFDMGYAVSLQADGKLVVAGVSAPVSSDSDFLIVRFNPNGSLDKAFGGTGWLLTDFGGYYDRAKALAIQPDGKIIAAGDSNNDFALARYHPDGNLDTSFSEDGLLVTDIYTRSDIGNALTLQADGKLVMAGTTLVCKDNDYAIVRYTSTGNLDRTFEGDGMLLSLLFEIKDYAYAILEQPDGKLILGGYINNGADDDFLLVRYK